MSSASSPNPWMEAGCEAGLVLAAQQGDCESYWELMEHYLHSVYRVAYALTRTRDDATQVTQDALMYGWKNLKHLPVGRPFLPWLLRTVRSLSVAARRRSAGAAVSEHEVGAGRVRERAFRGAFAELGPDEQLVLTLRVVEKLSYDAIGQVLEVPARTLLSRLSIARERMRTRVAARAAGSK